MPKAVSGDGTLIAYDIVGDGPPIILIDGAFGSRTMGPNKALAPLLADRFTVATYDRRGRGDSGDAAGFSVEREVEDIAAIVAAVGGGVGLYGISSGGALALEAASRVSAVHQVALYEVPFVVDDSRPPPPADYLVELERLLADDRRAAAVRYFMQVGIGLPAAVVALMRFMPAWRKLKAVAHTLPYDTVLTFEHQTGRPLLAQRWADVTQPTQVICGSKSPAWMRNAMQALAATLPQAEHRTLPGQTHLVKPKALAPVLSEFFAGGGTSSDLPPSRAAGSSGAGTYLEAERS